VLLVAEFFFSFSLFTSKDLTDGMVKILVDKETDRLLGVHILGLVCALVAARLSTFWS